jgi:hypothetical protein
MRCYQCVNCFGSLNLLRTSGHLSDLLPCLRRAKISYSKKLTSLLENKQFGPEGQQELKAELCMNFSLESIDEQGSKQELILRASSELLDQARTGIRQHCVRHCRRNDSIQACLTQNRMLNRNRTIWVPSRALQGQG